MTLLIKSNERNEDSYIGLADFFFRKSLHSDRCAFKHIDAFMNTLRYRCNF